MDNVQRRCTLYKILQLFNFCTLLSYEDIFTPKISQTMVVETSAVKQASRLSSVLETNLSIHVLQ